jgi:YNFM family putative membrane transporter
MSSVSDRRRTAAVMLTGFCAFLGLYSPQPMLPLLKEVFGLPTSTISLVVTVSTTAIALTAPFMGLLADRCGRRRTIVIAALSISVPTALAATATSFNHVLYWRILQGILTPAISATTVAYITEEWESGAGGAMSYYVGGTVLGGFAGRIICAFVAEWFNWRGAFLTLGLVNLAGGIAIWRWLPKDHPHRVTLHATGGVAGVLEHLRNPRLLATYAAGFCVLFTMIAAFTYVNFYLAAPPFGWGTRALGLLFTVYLVGAVSTMSSGRAIDRYGHQPALIASLLLAVAGILITLIHSAMAVILGLAICCSGAFIAQAAANSYIGVAAARNKGAAVGMYVTAYYVGGSFGAALPGRLWNWGGWAACVGLVTAVILITIGLAGLFWRGSAVAKLQTERAAI